MAPSSKTIKFEISLEKLVVKFEGDIQTAERIQTDLAGAINGLTSTQAKLLNPGQFATNPSPVIDVTPTRRKRRRRASSGAGNNGIDPALLDSLEGDGDSDAAADTAARRSSGTSAAALISGLKAEGFFSSVKTIGDIRQALAAKGHTFKSNEVSPSLVALTRQSVLKRQKNSAKQWVYFAD